MVARHGLEWNQNCQGWEPNALPLSYVPISRVGLFSMLFITSQSINQINRVNRPSKAKYHRAVLPIEDIRKIL